MNLSEFVDEDNTTFQPFDVNFTTDQPQYYHNYYDTLYTVQDVILYICLALGIPGNLLSAIIWQRRHVVSKNSSAVYLAALAVNDLLHLLIIIIRRIASRSWIIYYLTYRYLFRTTERLEPLLVLGFSVERLIAISCPLKVRFESM